MTQAKLETLIGVVAGQANLNLRLGCDLHLSPVLIAEWQIDGQGFLSTAPLAKTEVLTSNAQALAVIYDAVLLAAERAMDFRIDAIRRAKCKNWDALLAEEDSKT